ncbi:hypothetical protein E1B28_001685 [Marasmius oreades]|uniref:Chromatin modification-related protein n=1 Tax=Marasmius oreades TaxID=181124 RepID=A0A9P8AFP3_9AGAR|nr:uncharacterized protein E1B28_001685 [Marasmius oreades]KAG7099884.1 hypothetical protein E1B28_001685 [Marasmius oreades]
MAPLVASASSSSSAVNTAYSLSLLSEYTHTLDSLPIDLSRNFADLRELDAVLSSSMTSITAKITSLTQMIEKGTGLKEERLWLLTEIAEEAQRLKHGDEDKIRVACQAADNLKAHTAYLRSLSDLVPEFDATTLNRHTAYPHVAAKSYMPVALLEHGRRRRAAYGSLLTSATDPSPAKRKRVIKDDDGDGRTPRKERISEATLSRPRNGARAKKTDRGASPAESTLSVTSHNVPPPSQHQGSSSRGPSQLDAPRVANGNSSHASANKRARSSAYRGTSPSQNDQLPNGTSYGQQTPNHINSHSNNSRREAYHLPPSSSHPSLPLPYANGFGHSIPHPPLPSVVNDWNASRNQLEGPGMPARNGAGYAGLTAIPPVTNGIASEPPNEPDDGEADPETDDKPYCFCNRVSFGEMIACDSKDCEIEWFHLNCVALEAVPTGTWFCDTCKNKKNNKRSGRGGKRRAGGNRGGRGTAGA